MSDSVLVDDMNHSMSSGIDQSNEFNYRPVPPMAPVSLVFGIFSSIALLSYIGIGIGILGVLVGVICWFRIRRADGELGGKTLAIAGTFLSTIFVVSGLSLHTYAYATEVPEGFTRINFYHDISKKGFVTEDGKKDFHQDVKELEGKNIFVKGFMYPTRDTENLKSFLLVKDSDKCCFGGEPALTDMIIVEMKDGQTVDFHDRMVAVSGKFVLKDINKGGIWPPFTSLTEKFSVIQGPYSNMEKRVFCTIIVMMAAFYGLTFSGCNQSSESDYHSVTRNEESEEVSPKTETTEAQSKQSEPEKADDSEARPEKPASPVTSAKQETGEESKEPETAVKESPTEEDLNALSKEAIESAKKLKSRVDNNLQLAKEGKIEIRQVEWEEPVKAVKPEDLPPEDIVREVKILIPEKTFRKEGKEGLLRVSYDDIDLLKVLNMEPVTADAPDKMPSWLKELDGKRIRIRGFMYPHELMEGIEVFAARRAIIKSVALERCLKFMTCLTSL